MPGACGLGEVEARDEVPVGDPGGTGRVTGRVLPAPVQAAATPDRPIGFDPSAAVYRTRWVPVRQVIDLLHLTHRPDCVARYRAEMQAGARFPPISVVRVAGYYLVADGHKRLQAYHGLAPAPTGLVVECWPWRRWLRDQWTQFRRKQGQLVAALKGGPGGGRALLDLLWATLRHWWRVLRSLLDLILPRGADRTGGKVRR